MNAFILPPMPGTMVMPPIMSLLLFIELLLFMLPLLFVPIVLVVVGVLYIIPLLDLLFMAFWLFIFWLAFCDCIPCMAESPHATSRTASSNVDPINPNVRKTFMFSLLQCQITNYNCCNHHPWQR